MEAARQSVKDRDVQPATLKVIQAAFALEPIARENREALPAKLEDYDLSNDDHYDALVDLIGQWRMICGAMKGVDAVQIKMEATHMQMAHGTLTMAEVKMAIQFMVDQKLGINLPDYINFSCVFISKVLSAYEDVKQELLSKIIPVAEKNALIEPPAPSMQEKVETMRYMIRECSKHAKVGFKQIVFNMTVYSFLKKTGRIVITDEIKAEARKHADKQYAIYALAVPLNLQRSAVVIKKEGQALRKQYGVQYCLLHYFKQYPVLADLERALQEIQEADYERYQIGIKELARKKESLEAFCALCKRITGPAHHSGCDRADEKECAWYTPLTEKK